MAGQGGLGTVLVFSRTTGYRHESIPDGVRAVRELGGEGGWEVRATEDPAEFAAGLDGCSAVVFLSTSGDVLTPEGRAALAAFRAVGGGFVGVHAAACTEEGWPAFRDLLGARFTRHPDLQPGTVRVEDRAHPATAHLPAEWRFTDEWYDFDASPRGTVRVLASADETSYRGGGMGADHPLVWCREGDAAGGGRMFYTALGHTGAIWSDPLFRAHVAGGVAWACGATG
jgi:type 1 glutamine amidotransferase